MNDICFKSLFRPCSHRKLCPRLIYDFLSCISCVDSCIFGQISSYFSIESYLFFQYNGLELEWLCLVSLNISLYSFSSNFMYRAFIYWFVRGNFAQVDPTEALILILMDFIIHFYITKLVRQIDIRQSIFNGISSLLDFYPRQSCKWSWTWNNHNQKLWVNERKRLLACAILIMYVCWATWIWWAYLSIFSTATS